MAKRKRNSQTMVLEPQEVTIEKLVNGGQGLGTLPDGRKVFVWNALPGERAMVHLGRSKKSYAEGVASEVLSASPDRQQPKEPHFLATSPWQILPLSRENEYKRDIARDLFNQEGINLPDFQVINSSPEWHYRNKMEYSFYGDDDGVHIALYNRGTHQKLIVNGSILADSAIDAAALELTNELNRLGVRAGDLKSVIIRSEQQNDNGAPRAVAALFTKLTTFPKINLPASLKGLVVYHSNPRSPALGKFVSNPL